jgi:hypothetical protein
MSLIRITGILVIDLSDFILIFTYALGLQRIEQQNRKDQIKRGKIKLIEK